MRYCLDSDTIIYFLKGDKKIAKRLLKFDKKILFTTVINQSELLFGAYNSVKKDKNLSIIKNFLKELTIFQFEERHTEKFAQIKSKLQAKGEIIADMDLIIVAICIEEGLTLVSNNALYFKRIRGLSLENWRIGKF